MDKLSLPEHDLPCGISFLHQMSVSETYPIHTHDFYEIFYVVKGRAMHNINGSAESCLAGTLVFIRPEDVHAYSFISRYDMELISVGIQQDIMEEICAFAGIDMEKLSRAGLPPRVCLDVRRTERVTRSLMKLYDIPDHDKRRYYGKVLIAQLLLQIADSESEPQRIPSWLGTLVIEMSQPENFRIGLKRMVELSHVTQNHLNREMKKHLGITPTQFINARRITLAGDLLLEGRYNVLEIAAMCGFDTPSNFHSNFKRIYDCSPREFLERHTKQKE